MNPSLLAADAQAALDGGAVLLLDIEASTTALREFLGHTPEQSELEQWRICKAQQAHDIAPNLRVGTYWPGNEMTHAILLRANNLLGPDRSTPGVTITHDYLLGEHYMSTPDQTLS